MQKLILTTLAAALLSGCVSTKKYDALRAHAMRVERELETSRALAAELEAQRGTLQGTIDGLNAEKNALVRNIETLTAERERLTQANAALRTNYEGMLKDASAETTRMLRQIEANQAQLDENRRELDARMARMNELEAAIAARDSSLEKIKNLVSAALTGFEGKGLSISRRDGKVYVSMDDKLLFRSGSYEIDPKGADAVKDLGQVLAANPDIEIMVEGHTDNVPYNGTGQLRDNLDLSAKRATTVTRLLLQNKGIAPARIVSAGRGEWLPIDPADSAFARSRNRRTEIILTPKLDELLKITK